MKKLIQLYRSAFADLPREIWLLSIVLLVYRAGTMVLPFLVLYLTQEKGYSASLAGQLLGLYGLGAIIGAYFGGLLSDRIGPITVQKLSLITSAFGFLLLGHMDSLWSISLLVFVLAITAESFRPAAMTAAVKISRPQNRTRALALIRLAINIGMAIGPAMGGLLAVRNYQWLFIGNATTCFAAFILALIILPREQLEPAAHTNDVIPADRSPWRDGPFLWLMLLIVLMSCVFMQLFSTWPLYLRESYQLTEDRIGALWAVNTLIIIIFEMILVKAVEKKDQMRASGWGMLLMCAGFAVLPFGQTFFFAAFSVMIWTVGEMFALPLTNAIVGNRAGPKFRGRYMAFYTMAFSIAFVVAPIAGTAIYENWGPKVLWYLIGGLGILLALGFRALAPFFPKAVNPELRQATAKVE